MGVTVTVDDRPLMELIRATPSEKVIRIIADGTDYGIYQEFGPEEKEPGSKQYKWRFRPYMRPAIERVAPAFFRGLEQVKTWKALEAFVDAIAFQALGIMIDLVLVDTGNLKNSLHVASGEEYVHTYEPMKGGKPIE